MALHAAKIITFKHVSPVFSWQFYFILQHPKDFQKLFQLAGIVPIPFEILFVLCWIPKCFHHSQDFIKASMLLVSIVPANLLNGLPWWPLLFLHLVLNRQLPWACFPRNCSGFCLLFSLLPARPSASLHASGRRSVFLLLLPFLSVLYCITKVI